MKSIHVPLVKEPTVYHDCTDCGFRFMDASLRLSTNEEKLRYELHANDPAQAGYREYTAPLVNAIAETQLPSAVGLDYGSGADSAAYRMLVEKGFGAISRYDRFFLPDESPLVPGRFDFVYACEVVEHFYEPRAEFTRLRALLKPGGTLAVMTLLLQPTTDFENWHYRRDPTHVGFFSARSFTALANDLGFLSPEIRGPRTVLLRRSEKS